MVSPVVHKLLAIDPAFRLSEDISPKLAAPFYQAVAMLRTQKPLVLERLVAVVSRYVGALPIQQI